MRYVLAWLCLCGLAQAGELDGTYVLKGRDGYLVTKVQVKGSALQGVIEVPDGNVIRLRGSAQANEAHGTATSTKGNGDFTATLQGDTLNLIITQRAGPGQRAAELALRFKRAQAMGTTLTQ